MVKHDPPTSEKTYDDNPSAELKKAQGPVSPGKGNMGTVAAASAGADEPMHDRAPTVMKKAAMHLKSHSAGGIYKVGG
jgi:hypothetical protein